MNKIVKFILFTLMILICVTGLVLSFVFKYSTDGRFDVALDLVAALTSAIIGVSFQYYVAIWGDMLNYTAWSPAVRSLIRENQITKDTEFRISYGYLFRICVNGKYFLIQDNHKISNYKVPGGTYLISDEEKRYISLHYDVREDDQYATKDVLKNDYRLILPAKNLVPVYKRFAKAQKEDVGECFVKNIVLGKDILPEKIFKKVTTTFIRRDFVIKYPKHFKYFEMVLADIYEITLTDAQKDFFMDAIEKEMREQKTGVKEENSPSNQDSNAQTCRKFRFATVSEIMRRGVVAEENKLSASISDHSYKILPNLPRRKTPIEY